MKESDAQPETKQQPLLPRTLPLSHLRENLRYLLEVNQRLNPPSAIIGGLLVGAVLFGILYLIYAR